jgi:amino acid transporter
MNKMKKVKNFFFSQGAIISLIVLYVIAALVSGIVEYLNGASIRAVIFLRGGTVVLDALLIGLGVYALTRKWLNEKFLEKEFFKKRLFWLAYIAETLAIFLLFYLPYVGRSVFLLFDGEKIGMSLSLRAFIINLTLGFIFVIVLGAKMKKIIGKLKERANKNGFDKESDSST